jgi:hypothetical protein
MCPQLPAGASRVADLRTQPREIANRSLSPVSIRLLPLAGRSALVLSREGGVPGGAPGRRGWALVEDSAVHGGRAQALGAHLAANPPIRGDRSVHGGP